MTERRARWWLAAVLALAVVLRVWTFRPYGLHHPDELYQYLEQAHRLIFGQGIIPWEYRAGMRSWLPPLLLSLPMRLGEAISPGSQLPIILAKACVSAVSLAPVIAAYFLGARQSRLHGLVAAAVLAIWFENVYFSGHVLMEVLAVACFLPAAALIRPGASRRAMMVAGGLLALAALLRFHYGPALATFALVTIGTEWRSWRHLIAGALVVLAASAAVDMAMGQLPFGWIAANIHENVIEGGAERFGIFGSLSYFQMLWLRWGLVTPLLLLLPILMVRRFPGLFCAAMANLLVHMAIGHKEYRFIWLTVEIFVLLSAIASAGLLNSALHRWAAGDRARFAAALLLISGWAGGSVALAAADPMWPNWNRFGARMEAMAAAGRQQGLCGVAVHDLDYWSGTYTYLRQSVPLYLPWRRDPAEAARALAINAAAYNVVVAPESSSGDIAAGYRSTGCSDDGGERICVYRRSGGCAPDGAEPVLLQNVIARSNY